jgi:hypothetical protein
MTITYPPEMLPTSDDEPGEVIVCSNSECCLRAEVERLRAMILDACKVFEHYDLPEHAFHYRRILERSNIQ